MNPSWWDIQNYGNWDIEPDETITVSYSVNGAEEVTENVVLTELFESGSVIYHTFSETADFSEPGIYNIMTYTTYDLDMVESNDLALVSIEHYGSPDVDLGNGSDTLLVYEPVTLHAGPGYASYEWQDGSSDSTYYVDLLAAEWYGVIVTGENGCSTHDSVFVIYDLPDLAVSQFVSPVNSCSESGLTPLSLELTNQGYLSVTTEDTLYISYSLNGGASVIKQVFLDSDLPATQSTTLTLDDELDISQPGQYSLQVSLIFAKDVDRSDNTLITEVEVWDLPVVEIGTVQDTLVADLPVTLETGGGYTSYLWQDLSTGETFLASEEGLYWVTVSDSHGCLNSDSLYVMNTPVSVQLEKDLGRVQIYPNPASDVLHVELEMHKAREVVIELYSMSNTLVYKEEIKKSTVAESLIHVESMAPGVYALRITADQVPYNFLVVVE